MQSVEWRYIGSGQEAAQEQRAWPEARQGHSATVQHGRILIFGGSYPAATLNDSWILDPCAAQFEPYSMAVPGSSTPPVYISRVHESFRTTYLWFRVIPEGAVPEPRAGHAAVAIDPARMLVFGGNTSAATMQPELWCLELSIIHTSGDHTMPSQAGRWSLIEVIGQRPAARIGHSVGCLHSVAYTAGCLHSCLHCCPAGTCCLHCCLHSCLTNCQMVVIIKPLCPVLRGSLHVVRDRGRRRLLLEPEFSSLVDAICSILMMPTILTCVSGMGLARV
eukprot:SAG31_NODE_122_length_23797_cov_39.343812_25_plen_277_part_00